MITSGDKEEAEKEPLPKVRFDLVFTSYGIQFMRACQGPAQSVVPNPYTADEPGSG
jgi:hypothetical protein